MTDDLFSAGPTEAAESGRANVRVGFELDEPGATPPPEAKHEWEACGSGLLAGMRGELARRAEVLEAQGRGLETIGRELSEYRDALHVHERALQRHGGELQIALGRVEQAAWEGEGDSEAPDGGLGEWIRQIERLWDDLKQQRRSLEAERQSLGQQDRRSDELEVELAETRSQRDDAQRELEVVRDALDRQSEQMDLLRDDLREQFQLAESVRREAMAQKQRLAQVELTLARRAMALADRERRLEAMAARIEYIDEGMSQSEPGQEIDEPLEPAEEQEEQAPLLIFHANHFGEGSDQEQRCRDPEVVEGDEADSQTDDPAEADDGEHQPIQEPVAESAGTDPFVSNQVRGVARLDEVWAKIAEENAQAPGAEGGGADQPDQRPVAITATPSVRTGSGKRMHRWVGKRTIHLPDDFNWVKFGLGVGYGAAAASVGALSLSLLKFFW